MNIGSCKGRVDERFVLFGDEARLEAAGNFAKTTRRGASEMSFPNNRMADAPI